MWTCPACGCMSIADSLGECPVCGAAMPDPAPGTPRTAEDDVRDGLAAPEPDEDGGTPSRPPSPSGKARSRSAKLPPEWGDKE